MILRALGVLLLSFSVSACSGGDDSSGGNSGAGGTASGGNSGSGGSGVGGSGTGGSSTGGGGGRLPPPVGPLEGLPSDPGPHVATIQALGDGEWLSLGAPEADPQFGKGRGRSWGGRAFALAPGLRGAFFTGEGVHAYVKPDGYGMDDVFFYDLNANRWIAVYPGMHVASFTQRVKDGELVVNDHGDLVDQDGQPIPVHTLIHAWDFLTYDPEGQKFAFLAGNGLGRYYLPGEAEMDEGLTIVEAEIAAKSVPPKSPWFYDVASGKFEHYPITGEKPLMVQDLSNFGAFQYLPAQKRYFYGCRDGVAFFDPAAPDWTVVNDQGQRPTGYDLGTAFDPTRNRVYVGPDGGGMYIYDLATDTWSTASTAGAPSGSGTNSASIFYDTANDVITVMHYGDATLYVYAADSDSWTSQSLPDEMLSSVSYPSVNAFYDPELNAYFVHLATDSEDNGVMWAFRYKNP
jgi:hypothetical protein